MRERIGFCIVAFSLSSYVKNQEGSIVYLEDAVPLHNRRGYGIYQQPGDMMRWTRWEPWEWNREDEMEVRRGGEGDARGQPGELDGGWSPRDINHVPVTQSGSYGSVITAVLSGP